MSKAKDYYSKSVPEAIRQACDDFATSQEKLDIEVLETGSKGIFGLCKKRAHIRVNLKKNAEAGDKKETPGRKEKKGKPPGKEEKDFVIEEACGTEEKEKSAREEKKKPPRPRPRPEEHDSPAAGREADTAAPPTEEAVAEVKEELEKILSLMGLPSRVVVRLEEQSLQCNIKGDHEEEIVGQEGRTLDSLQYLVRKMFSTRLPERINIDLDVGNFREQREQELQNLAREMAEQVRETGKTMAIPALNPSERRVVHVTLQEDKKVRSRSVGDGIFKKVLIFKPGSKGRKSGGKRKGRQGGGPAKQ
jgi:spoIIIJ-associated protein